MSHCHILMPAYNVQSYIFKALESISMQQDVEDLRVFIIDDGSKDNTVNEIKRFIHVYPHFENKIYLETLKTNRGVAHARTALFSWSKRISQNAYIFSLDADDHYAEPRALAKILEQFHQTHADICLINYRVEYEDELQKENAAGLLSSHERNHKFLDFISEKGSASPLELMREGINVLTFTSLGWTKIYSSGVEIPTPENCPFEDFVYMAALLKAKQITALPSSFQPYVYLRRSNSCTGNRTVEHFIHDIPQQLNRFLDIVSEMIAQEKPVEDKALLVAMGEGFIDKKIKQYDHALATMNKNNPAIFNSDVVQAYHDNAKRLSDRIFQLKTELLLQPQSTMAWREAGEPLSSLSSSSSSQPTPDLKNIF